MTDHCIKCGKRIDNYSDEGYKCPKCGETLSKEDIQTIKEVFRTAEGIRIKRRTAHVRSDDN